MSRPKLLDLFACEGGACGYLAKWVLSQERAA